MQMSTVMAAQVPSCAKVAPGFQKSLHMKLTTLEQLSGQQQKAQTTSQSQTRRSQQRTDQLLSSKIAQRDRIPEAKPVFLSSTKNKARNLLDMMKVNNRTSKQNEI